MMRIERHAIEIGTWPKKLHGRRAFREQLHGLPFPLEARVFRGYADLGQLLLAALSVVERDAEDQLDAARALGQGYAGVLALGAAAQGASIELPFGDRRGPARGTGPTSSTDATAWVNGWYGALMARDTESLDRLCAIDDEVHANSSTRTDAYHFAWKAALIAAHNGGDVVQHVNAARNLTKPPHRKIAGDAAAAADTAAFSMLPTIVESNATAFQEKLAGALQAHRALCDQADPGGRDYGSFVAWGPLALSCLAADCGIPVEIESDYLMPRLIARRS